MVIKRGDMFYADLSPVVGSEQGGSGKGWSGALLSGRT